jgi:hypothetical protein
MSARTLDVPMAGANERRGSVFRGLMRFRLQALFVVLTAICIGLAFLGYRTRGEGRFRAGACVAMEMADSPYNGPYVAKEVRSRTSKIRHLIPDPNGGELLGDSLIDDYSSIRKTSVADRIFYEVTLSDGSTTQVAFWIYHGRNEADMPRVAVVCVLDACDTPADVLTGAADKRRRERFQLLQQYTELLARIYGRTAGANATSDGALMRW